MLGAFKTRQRAKLARRALIVTTVRPAHMVWPMELWKWRDFHGFTFRVLHGSDKQNLLDAEQKDPSDICITNVESLAWLFDAKVVESEITHKKSVKVDPRRVKALGFDTLVLDELSLFKHTTSIRFKILKDVIHYFTTRWGGTGSPAANHLEALFSETFVLDEGRTFGRYVTAFRKKYFVPSYDGYSWKPQDGAQERIFDAVKPVFYRVEPPKGTVKEPQIVLNDILVDLPPAARKIYDEMKKDLVAVVAEGERSFAANGGVLVGKLKQISNGGLYIQHQDPATGLLLPRETRHLHDAKTEALKELVEELQGSPLFVAYEYDHDLDRLLKMFGKDIPILGSGNSIKRDLELQAAWNQGDIPILLAHPQAVGHGLNLQMSCRNVCWYAMTHNRELYDQFNKRVARQGNPAGIVTVHRLQGRRTIDQQCATVLHARGNVEQALYAAILDYLKNEK
ncbi:hypothetical protein KGP36_02425 [Patescibacteria group bacterium]|nr:hypothetical protein [Patescibacteria group bacterium]